MHHLIELGLPTKELQAYVDENKILAGSIGFNDNAAVEAEKSPPPRRPTHKKEAGSVNPMTLLTEQQKNSFKRYGFFRPDEPASEKTKLPSYAELVLIIHKTYEDAEIEQREEEKRQA